MTVQAIGHDLVAQVECVLVYKLLSGALALVAKLEIMNRIDVAAKS